MSDTEQSARPGTILHAWEQIARMVGREDTTPASVVDRVAFLIGPVEGDRDCGCALRGPDQVLWCAEHHRVDVLDDAALEGGAPARGGEVETWVKRWRDRYVQEGDTYRDKFGWDAINEMLDDLRDRSDIGASWSDVLDETAPVPTVLPADDRHTSAGDLGLCHGVDSCVHGRSVWDCPECEAGRLSELVSLWGQDTASVASCRRSVRMVWPELAERLDDLLDQQDGGGKR